MSAEWQARQLLLMASAAAPPGNTRSPAGRSTVTDLNTGAAWAQADRGQSATPIDRPIGRILVSISLPPHAAVTGVVSMTLRMKPAAFQFAASGCATPLLLVQRTIREWAPLSA